MTQPFQSQANRSTADAISRTHQSHSCGDEQPQAENPTHRAHNSTMPPKSTRVKKWNTADDKKLQDLVRRKVNGITTSSAKSNVEKLIEHWPDRKKNFKSFGALVRPKLQQLELDGYLSHAREIHEGESFSCVDTKRFSSNSPHFFRRQRRRRRRQQGLRSWHQP